MRSKLLSSLNSSYPFDCHSYLFFSFAFERLEYLTYCHLLQRYLEVKYGSICEAKSAYLILMSRLEEMHDLNEHCMELMLKMDLNWAKYVGPITSELYDLNLKLQQQKMQQQQQQMQQQTIT